MTTTRTFDKLNRLRTMASTPAGNPTRPLRYEYNYNDALPREIWNPPSFHVDAGARYAVAPDRFFPLLSHGANQRVNVLHGDGSYWVYNYDRLGQISSAKKFWKTARSSRGQSFSDPISGNLHRLQPPFRRDTDRARFLEPQKLLDLQFDLLLPFPTHEAQRRMKL
jgi:hypothetical protein